MNRRLEGPARKTRALLAAGILVALGVLSAVPLSPTGRPGMCVLRNLTGLPCPLCGGTRAAQALTHGDVSRAVELNILALPVVFVLAALALVAAVEAARGRTLADWSRFGPHARRVALVAATLVFLWWIPRLTGAVRNGREDLVDLQNPVARRVAGLLGRPENARLPAPPAATADSP